MSLPDFKDRLNQLVDTFKEDEASFQRRKKAAEVEAKERDSLRKKDFRFAGIEAAKRLKSLGVLSVMESIENAMVRIYGYPPGASRIGRLFEWNLDGYKRSSYGYADSEQGLLYKEVVAGRRFGGSGSEKVPAFSLSVVCRYSPGLADLALGSGRIKSLNFSGDWAVFDDPCLTDKETGVPFVPLIDWTRERFQELAWDNVSNRQELIGLVGQLRF